MRVVIANNFAHVTGGADRHCFDLAKLLRRDGHEVAFISTRSDVPVETSGAFVPLRVTNATRDHLTTADSLQVATRAFWNRASARAMDTLIERFRPDVISVHKIYPHLSISPLIAAASRGVPIVQTVHDYEFIAANAFDPTSGKLDNSDTRARYRALNTSLFQLKRRYHVPLVTDWIAVSQATADIYSRAGIDATPILNTSLVQSDGEAVGFGERSGVLYAGRLTPEKGVDDVIELARELRDCPVRVAGHGPLANHVQLASSRIPNLTYLGTLTQQGVQDELRRSRVCVMPSHWPEPGPLACLEAMAAGTPMVAYRYGGLAEYVEGSHAGLVVGDDVSEFVSATRRLLSDEAAWQRTSDAARLALTGLHAPRRHLDLVTGVFERASRSSGHTPR